MKLRDFALLCDANVDLGVAQWLRSQGFDAIHVSEVHLQGASDAALLRHAYAESRLIVTHDADFGRLVILEREPLLGVIYLRPGHIDPQFTIGSLASIIHQALDLSPPFILVARRRDDGVAIRLRRLLS